MQEPLFRSAQDPMLATGGGPEMVLAFRQENREGCTRRFATLKLARDSEIIADPWIEFVGEPEFPLPSNLDGLVLLVLFFCMRRGGRLVVEGPVSPSLVRSLRYFQQAWLKIRPGHFNYVEIAPAELTEQAPSGDRAISAFSGGIDSIFLVLQQTSEDLGLARYPLTDVMFGHGLDIAVEDTDAFNVAVDRSREFLDSVSLRPRLVRTNVRQFKLPNWEDCHGAIICGLLHQYSHEFGHGLIASTNSYDNVRMDLGSNPAIDHLTGSRSFPIVHDGAGYWRIEKIVQVARNPIATKSARVCWQKSSGGTNCGVCEKCVTAQLGFLAAGHPNPACFDRPLDIGLIKTITASNMSRFRGYQSMLEISQDRKAEPWRIALEKRLRVLRRERYLSAARNALADILGLSRQ